MEVHFRVRFISTVADFANLKQPWWDARKFTTAVKTRQVNGFFHIPRGLINHRVDQKNVQVARQIFGRWVLNRIHVETGGENVAVVPIPCSDAVIDGAGPYRHYETIAESLRYHDHAHELSDVMRFSEALQKASQGGPRFEDQIYPKLRLSGAPPTRAVVLVDDILTSGGHMKACKAKLERAGATVLFGVVCGRTVTDTKGDPWEFGLETI